MILSFKLAKGSFFDKVVAESAVDKARLRVLSRFGAYVRRTARNLLRPARRRKLAEMGPEDRQRYHIRESVARRKGDPKPKLPQETSRAGSPPRLHKRSSPLKRLLFFAYDRANRSVVIGPTRFAEGVAPSQLEYGLGPVRGSRPFMGPSLAKESPKLPGMWRDAI